MTADKPKYSDARIPEMIERAKQAREQSRALRKQAPDGLLLNPIQSVEQKVLIDKYAKKMGFKGQDDPKGMHLMFGDRDQLDQYPDEGYEPVLDRSSGGTQKMVTCKGDPLLMIPTDIHEARLKDNAARANRLAREKAKADALAGSSPVAYDEQHEAAAVGSPKAAEMARKEAGVV